MSDGVVFCKACQRWHGQPVPCDHNPDAPCLSCGGKRGYRWTGDNGQAFAPAWMCWPCADKQETGL